MAYSTQSAVSDGTLAVLPLSIDYLSRDDITVYLGSAQAVKDVAWSWVGTIDRSIKFTPAVPKDVVVTVKRSTGVTGLYHKFSGGAQFTSKTLDESLTQTLFVAQEFSESSSVASDDLPLPVGSQASAGKSNKYARTDHVHVGMTGGAVGSVVMDTFTGDGVKLAFTLQNTPTTKGATQVFIDSVYQSKQVYSLTGPTITFDEAPAVGAVIEVVTVTIGGGKASDIQLNETPELLATDTGGNVQGGMVWLAKQAKKATTDLAAAAGATLVGYIQAGTGAVKRTLQDRLRDRVSVKDFGAKGDGTTDDTAPVQAAINYLCSLSIDGDLTFPPGPYRLTAPLTIGTGRNIRLVGQGSQYTGATLLIDHGGAGIYAAATSDQTWDAENLVIRSNGAATYGIQILSNSVYQKFSKLTLKDFNMRGIDLAKPFSCVLEYNEVIGNKDAGIALRGGSGTLLLKNTVEFNPGSGYVINGEGHTLVCPYNENNCWRNDPTGENGNYREFLLQGNHINIVGGTLAARGTNNKVPIEITGSMVSINGIKSSSKGTSANWILLTGLYANVLLTNSEMDIIDGGSGSGPNAIQVRPGSPGSFTADVLIGGVSVAGSLIVDQGVDATNGRWVRYANGRQECFFQGFYQASGTNYDKTWTFPRSFVDTKAVVMGHSAASDPAYRANALVRVKAVTTGTAVLNFTDSDIGYNVMAVGYWK